MSVHSLERLYIYLTCTSVESCPAICSEQSHFSPALRQSGNWRGLVGGQPGLLLPKVGAVRGLVGPLPPVTSSKPALHGLGCNESALSPGASLLSVGDSQRSRRAPLLSESERAGLSSGLHGFLSAGTCEQPGNRSRSRYLKHNTPTHLVERWQSI